jgi:hypothetical protein
MESELRTHVHVHYKIKKIVRCWHGKDAHEDIDFGCNRGPKVPLSKGSASRPIKNSGSKGAPIKPSQRDGPAHQGPLSHGLCRSGMRDWPRCPITALGRHATRLAHMLFFSLVVVSLDPSKKTFTSSYWLRVRTPWGLFLRVLLNRHGHGASRISTGPRH